MFRVSAWLLPLPNFDLWLLGLTTFLFKTIWISFVVVSLCCSYSLLLYQLSKWRLIYGFIHSAIRTPQSVTRNPQSFKRLSYVIADFNWLSMFEFHKIIQDLRNLLLFWYFRLRLTLSLSLSRIELESTNYTEIELVLILNTNRMESSSIEWISS